MWVWFVQRFNRFAPFQTVVVCLIRRCGAQSIHHYSLSLSFFLFLLRLSTFSIAVASVQNWNIDLSFSYEMKWNFSWIHNCGQTILCKENYFNSLESEYFVLISPNDNFNYFFFGKCVAVCSEIWRSNLSKQFVASFSRFWWTAVSPFVLFPLKILEKTNPRTTDTQ